MKSFKILTVRNLLIVVGFYLATSFNACSGVNFNQDNAKDVVSKNGEGEKSQTNPNDNGIKNDPNNTGTSTRTEKEIADDCSKSDSKICLALVDKFEREDVSDHPDFNWSKLVYDGAGSPNNLDIDTLTKSIVGPFIPQGDRALYLRGREGLSVHALFLNSKTIDLKDYKTAEINVDVLMLNIESYSYNGDAGKEYVTIQICKSTPQKCKKSDSAESTHWVTIAKYEAQSDELDPPQVTDVLESIENGESIESKESVSASNWSRKSVKINLNEVTDINGNIHAINSSQFMFRIGAKIDNGIANHQGKDWAVDLIGFDDLALFAFK